MRFPKLIASALMAGSLAVGGVALARSDSFYRDSDATQFASGNEAKGDEASETKRLKMSEIIKLLSDQGYSDFREIEREGRNYEVEARDSEGRWMELDVDASNGDVIKVEEDD